MENKFILYKRTCTALQIHINTRYYLDSFAIICIKLLFVSMALALLKENSFELSYNSSTPIN